MRIQLGIEPGTISHVTLVDYGGNINFKGLSLMHSSNHTLLIHALGFSIRQCACYTDMTPKLQVCLVIT